MNSVVHFEMPYDDRERMAKFYGSAFGWQTQMLGEEMGNYVLATTTESDERGPKRPGTINGGFFPKKPDWPAQYPSVVIAVDDIKESARKVTDAGGRVLGERDRDTWSRAICVILRHRGQPCEHAPAHSTQLAWVEAAGCLCNSTYSASCSARDHHGVASGTGY